MIRTGKIIPFLFAAIVAFGYCENIYAIICGNVVELPSNEIIYYCPISLWIGNVVYIDWVDVFLLYILAFALEFCKYNFRAVHYLLLNLAVRLLLENVSLSENVIIPIAWFMALFGAYCVYGGFNVLSNTKQL